VPSFSRHEVAQVDLTLLAPLANSPSQMEAAIRDRQTVLFIILTVFALTAIFFVGGYFYFLHLMKKSREKGEREAEEEERL
jgi:nitrate reductase NapE component